MSRRFLIVWVGRQRRDAWEELCDDYRGRIARFVDVDDLPLRARTSEDGIARLRAEAETVLEALPDPAWVVACHRRGRQLTSRGLATELSRRLRDWPHPVVWVVGSDLGLDDSVLERADATLSFGPLTLPHQLARLVLYEQLYRALSIRAGMDYHRKPL